MRRVLLLATSLLLVLGLGGVAGWAQLEDARRVKAVQASARQSLQHTLGGLTDQYFTFTFLASQTAANQTTWSLRPGKDQAALERLVRASALTRFGAALTDLTGTPLSSWTTSSDGLPAGTDPGYATLRADLLAGRPGLSGVMRAGRSRVVAFGVPVTLAGHTRALLLTYADISTWPLQGYNATLSVGPSAQALVIDPQGTVAASSDLTDLGRSVGALVRTGQLTEQRWHDQAVVVSAASAHHGWTVATVQPLSAYSAGLTASRQREVIALAGLLTLMIVLLVLFHHKRQQALHRLAEERMFDALTGLPLRRLFEIRYAAAVARARRSNAPLGVLYCDLDGFKAINDSHGHNSGDQLLRTVAERVCEVLRDEDFVARLGGDEFVVLVEGPSPAQLQDLIGRLTAAVEQPVRLGASDVAPRISIGGALLIDARRSEELLHEADLAMYAMKQGSASAGAQVRTLTHLVPGPRPHLDAAARAQ